jgi:hypothetical protein
VQESASHGRVEFDLDAADTLECLLKELPSERVWMQLNELLPDMTKADLTIARRLCEAGVIVVG